MLSAVLVAGLIATRAPVAVVGITVAALATPEWFAAAIVALAAVRWLRAPAAVTPGDETALLLGMAAELRAGASLRAALAAGAARAPRLDLGSTLRLAAAGAPMPALSDIAPPRKAAASITWPTPCGRRPGISQ